MMRLPRLPSPFEVSIWIGIPLFMVYFFGGIFVWVTWLYLVDIYTTGLLEFVGVVLAVLVPVYLGRPR